MTLTNRQFFSALALVASCGLGAWVWRTSDVEAAETEAPSTRSADVNVADKLLRLEREAASTRGRLAAAERRLAERGEPEGGSRPLQDDAGSTAQSSVERAEEADRLQKIAEEKEAAQIEKAKVGFLRRWQNESSDDVWTGDVVESVGVQLTEQGLSGTQVKNVDCRKSLCRIETLHDGAETFRKYIHTMSGAALGGSTFFSFDEETRTAIVYASRPGEQLPDIGLGK